MNTIILSVIVMGILGFVCAGLLAIAAHYFKIEEDPRVAAILQILPNANCGVCGYAGCAQFAEKVVNGEASPDSCPVGKQKVAARIREILGKKA